MTPAHHVTAFVVCNQPETTACCQDSMTEFERDQQHLLENHEHVWPQVDDHYCHLDHLTSGRIHVERVNKSGLGKYLSILASLEQSQPVRNV